MEERLMVKTTCEYCKYEMVSSLEEPCSSCKHAFNIGSKEYEYGKENFEPKEEHHNREEMKTIRRQTLEKAIKCVCGERENEYGSPEDNFKTIANMWNAYLCMEAGITATDVAMMMALLKIARIATGTAKEDSFIDLAGYAACGAEIAQRSKEEN